MADPTPTPTPTPTPAPAPWHATVADEGLRGAVSKFESREKLLDAIGYKPPAPAASPDWRTLLKSDDAKKFAEASPDVDHLVTRALDMRRQLSTAIVPPGKDAKPEEISAYRKRVGVPDAVDGYKFKRHDGAELTEADKAFHSVIGKTMHDHNVPAPVAEALNEAYNDFTAKALQAQVDADKQFADQSEAELRRLWPGAAFDQNHEYANRAAAVMFGDQIGEVRALETKAGKFVLDHPLMVRALASVGREMAEGGLVPPLSEKDRGSVNDQIADVRKKIAEAQASGNSREANRLYTVEQELLAKTKGNAPIVGAGRAA